MSYTQATPALTTVLRKRKRSSTLEDPLVLHLSSSPSPSCYEPGSESETDQQTVADKDVASSSRDCLDERVRESTDRRYKCSYNGCTKAYSKPSRLVEHERAHTGERPYVCSVCNKSYLRESHLQAHARSHKPNSARPFLCEEEGCGKRFWTSQHLRAHIILHKGEKPFKCTVHGCDLAFLKHHQLREHICTAHAPPGTKPYRCEHTGCTKSFATNQKLRAHVKTHDEKRYTCVHSNCQGTSAAYFPTWTALQHHMRTTHPPTCPHASCNGKTFTAQKGLRAHLKLHGQRDLEAELQAEDSSSENEEQLTKRRRGGEVGRDFLCDVPGCGKDFKSKKALGSHHKVSHLGRRDFVCPHETCGRAFGYKHLLQRHLVKLHPEETPTVTVVPSQENALQSSSMQIDSITGVVYASNSKRRLENEKSLQCPYPDLNTLTAGAPSAWTSGTQCVYVFSRAYDLRRHLKASHGVDLEKDVVEEWVRGAKRR
ncbi:hypothetical protein K474DRAFT_1658926 [Panus rudis PR-1116 ss-1]|nr:hypothetical protein K474DRAFT_1658926 [Panus rudis PR-1116 ss-1]